MDTTTETPAITTPRVRLSIALEQPIHAAMTACAASARRSLAAEINTACDEHIRAGLALPPAPSVTATHAAATPTHAATEEEAI